MSLVEIYECLCDETRLRILHLLGRGELCVCHLQEILKQPQVKISKHLGYLRARGLVEARRDANWMVYSLPGQPPPELEKNLACLQDCVAENPVFRRDAALLAKIGAKLTADSPVCCGQSQSKKKSRQTLSP